MPAQLEEVIAPAHPLHAQQRLPDPRQRVFGFANRRLVGAARERVGLRRRQRAAVELAVRRQRQRVEMHERGRHHVVRQARPQRRAQGFRLLHLTGVIAHQSPVTGQTGQAGHVLARQHRRRLHAGHAAEPRLDLAQLDPEAANLHLIVVAAQIVERAVGQPAGQVTGPVHPRVRLGVERIAHEALGRQRLAVQVAARHAGAADVHLARHAHRHRLAVPVEHVQAQVRDRHADRAAPRAPRVVGMQRAVRDVDRRLRDPVHVHELRAGIALAREPRLQHARLQRLAAEHHLPQPVCQPALALRRDQLLERARRLVQHRHALVAQQPVERLRRPADQRRHHHQPAAVQQRAPDLPHREVERERMKQRPHVLRAEPEPRRRGREQPRHVAMLDHHALRLAGGARRVDHIGQMVRSQLGQPRIVCRHGGERRVVEIDRRERMRAERGAARCLHQHRHRRAVGEHVAQPRGRIGRVHRHVAGARLQHAQHAHHQRQPTLDADRHAIVGPHAARDQVMREPVRARVQFAVGQPFALMHHRDRIGRALDLRLEARMNGRVRRRVARQAGLGRAPAGDPRALLGRDDGEPVERRGHLGQHLVEQMPETLRQRLDLVLLEIGLVVDEMHPDLIVEPVLAQIDGQRRLLMVVRTLDGAGHRLAEPQVVVVALVGQRDIEHLRTLHAPQSQLAIELADREALVAIVLLQQRAQRRQQLAERQRVVEAQTHRADAGEHAERGLQLGVGAVQDRQADGQVLAPGGPGEVDIEHGEDHVERGRIASLRQRHEALVIGARQAETVVAARHHAAARRRLETRREQRLRHVAELVEPVGAMLVELRRLAILPVLLDELHIGRRRQCRHLPGLQLAVDRAERIEHQADGPAVDDQVVMDQHQLEIRLAELQQLEAEQPAALQDERRFQLPVHAQARRRVGIVERGKIGKRQRERHLARDLLHRHAVLVLHRRQHDAQRVVLVDQQPDRLLHAHGVHLAGDPHVAADVVDRRIAMHLLVEPDFPLRTRQSIVNLVRHILIHEIRPGNGLNGIALSQFAIPCLAKYAIIRHGSNGRHPRDGRAIAACTKRPPIRTGFT